MKLILRATTYAVLLSGLVPFVASVLLLSAASLPSLLGFRSYIVLTGSMEPAVPVGSVVVSREVPPEDVRVGDVITFFTDHAPGVNVTHRVVGIDDEHGQLAIHTKGDSNGEADSGTVDLHQGVGRMAYVVPWAGNLIEALRTGRGRLALAGMGLLVLLGSWLQARWPGRVVGESWPSLPWRGSPSQRRGVDLSPRRLISAAVVITDLVLLATFVPGLVGYRTVPVESDRLGPEIPMGAMLVEGPVTAERLQPGDVISLMTPQAPGTIFTDRVSEVADNPGMQTVDIRTRPIGADEERNWHVYRNQPIGKVVYWVPLTGLLFHAPIPQLLFGGLTGALCCVWVVSKFRARREQGFADSRHTAPTPTGEPSLA